MESRNTKNAWGKNSVMVHQGIDLSRFNPIQVPRLIKKPLIIFAGGKIEARKGQDIVIEAFKKFIRYCPEDFTNSMLGKYWGHWNKYN